ncbi:alpha-D-ribose 1-methylphosphonate 5-triphosphate diphosphatase [soil metagenome]
MDARLLIQGGTGLVHVNETRTEWCVSDIATRGNRIGYLGSSMRQDGGVAYPVFDASGLLILPGIVDIHGDAFERQIQPRPATVFSHDIALADTDRQLVANGITTACHGLTYSWEGGLRGRKAALAMLDQVAQQRKTAQADHRIHLRFENHHLDGVADVLEWIAQGRIDFFAFNEHLPSIAASVSRPGKLMAYAERARCDSEAYLARLNSARSRSTDVPEAIELIAAACREHGIPMASHDDTTCFDREAYQSLGVTISEFPKTQDALFTAMALNNQVVMGAPNVLLGGSHCGGLSAIDAVRSGMCDILASDYYYPSLLHAAFKLTHVGACTLAEAWRLVSENPAASLGLADRGRITEGYRADLIMVEAGVAGAVRLIATIAGGKLAYCAEPERLATHQAYSLAA